MKTRQSPEGAWRILKVRDRKCLLERLGITHSPLAVGVDFERAVKEGELSKLPIPVRVMLAPAFGNGRFSKAAQNRSFKSTAELIRELDAADHEYENAPDAGFDGKSRRRRELSLKEAHKFGKALRGTI